MYFRGSRYLLQAAMTPASALKILSLAPSSELTSSSIKKAYIRQTLECHPDLHPNDPNATDNFRQLSDALRVALKALECRSIGTAAELYDRDDDIMYDSHAALEALRRAMLAYRMHQSDSAGGDDGANDETFYTPSLEYVSAVCQQENQAMRRVRTFCSELPSVLCGSTSAALFEAVAFFHSRYVESTAECVLRFSKDLPVIVRRVVRNRKKYIKSNKHDKKSAGFGTTAANEQTVESMSMKPLVLMGALVFDLPPRQEDGNGSAASTHHDAGVTSSTCGVSSPRDIQVTSELQCTIYPSDSIGTITDKMGKWEAASFARLKVEMAIVDVCGLLSSLLGLELSADISDGGGHSFAVTPHLQSTQAETEQVLHSLQALSAQVCDCFDDKWERDTDITGVVDDVLSSHGDGMLSSSKRSPPADVPSLIVSCRKLAAVACPFVEGNIPLRWPLGSADDTAGKTATAARRERGFQVARHPSCCTAETLRFAVSVDIVKDLTPFLLSLQEALETVIVESEKAKQLLGELIHTREQTTMEEFLRIETKPEEERQNEKEEGEEENDIQYRYRGPIQVFPRLYNMSTSRELSFWKLLHANREYVAQHAPGMNAVNIFFECLPYEPGLVNSTPPSSESQLPVGWVGDDNEGCDSIIIHSKHLENTGSFTEWLEDAVEQSTLNKECHKTLNSAGIGYVFRDTSLPLTNFLSFIRVFSQAAAVRAVIESRHTLHASRVLSGEDVGLHIIVGTRCDVRDGGRLMIPWHMDPNILLALLGDSASKPQNVLGQ